MQGYFRCLADDVASNHRAKPPLTTRDSHTGYLSHTSPLITTTTVDDAPPASDLPQSSPLRSAISVDESGLSPRTLPSVAHSPTLPIELPSAASSTSLLSPVFPDRSNTTGDPNPRRKKSISSSFRSISPGRKLREAFQSGKSPRLGSRGSPEREFKGTKGFQEQNTEKGGLGSRSPAPDPLLVGSQAEAVSTRSTTLSLPRLDSGDRPQTPPSAKSIAPSTTVTPPTPVDARAPIQISPTRASYLVTQTEEPSNNVAGHRRLHSDTNALHPPSKLSNAISAPLTPTIEEIKTPSVKADSRNITPSSGFFSTWVSAAQNAANTITNTLNTQNRSRANTDSEEPGKPELGGIEGTGAAAEGAGPPLTKKQLAVETLGAGSLSLSHLGFDSDTNEAKKTDLMESKKDSAIRRDEAAAKAEDILAKRAVSAAYEKPSENSARTPIAESSDPIHNLRHGATFQSNGSGDLQTTPNGSILEGESGSVKRNNSVRSRLKERRKRGSSTATGGSAVGTLLAASASSLANPTAAPKLAGFAVAPKARNRSFHQLFRSVPEDDFLIEDYSCALQKEILLAGRIYISEGHICFSSNILGWVTTLVISFEHIVAVEKETTAMVFPNAIAIQTLQARHTFRSLLSREATYDLMIGIWKASHPAAFKKSSAGAGLAGEEPTAPAGDKGAESESISDDASDEEDEVYDEDEEDDGVGSFIETRSSAGSELVEASQSMPKNPPVINGTAAVPVVAYPPAAADAQAAEKAVVAAAAATVDFPGPSTHGPTDCTDAQTHYDKIIKDETIPAPLGKIYSMLFGPTSGVFLRKYLLDEQKVTELQYEDDKKGLGEQNKSRSYSYIKPLYGAIGPKQTKCSTTENLDAFDLERAVSVTCTTQTPDVPSGNVFSVKTRYCLSWAAGNSTRFQMNCTVEWTGKSWLKGMYILICQVDPSLTPSLLIGPIEKGATDGQMTYGNDLVKAMKAAVTSRPRTATNGSKMVKGGKKKKKSEKGAGAQVKSQDASQSGESWGLLEPLRSIFGPVVDIISPVSGPLAIGIIILLLFTIWFRRPAGSKSGSGYVGYPNAARLAAYEEMWRNEESDLWQWLEDRVGIDGLALNLSPDEKETGAARQAAKARAKERQKVLRSKDADARLNEERMSEREMEEAIRTTQERLEVLKGVMERKKLARQSTGAEK